MNLIKKHLCNSILFFILPLSVFLTFNKHSKSRPDSYKSVIWADAAGYYVYLPSLFLYNNVTEFPDSIEIKTGNGFSLNLADNNVFTKYTSGVALMQLPFFVVSHISAKLFNLNPNGFSILYQYGIMIAAVFYGCFGLWFLCKFLMIKHDWIVSFVVPLVIYLCTNLFYYAIDASGMSHVYSFFLLAVFMFYSAKFILTRRFQFLLILLPVLALAVLIRPTNILFVLFLFFYEVNNPKELKSRIKLLFEQPRFLVYAIVISILIFIPQLTYWFRVSGNALFYSYGNEGFSNWCQPRLLEIWFSTKNGLFLYSPVLMLSICGIVLMILNKKTNGWLVAVIFIITSYLFASWHDWTFGCSFGSRPFIEYYPLMSIPLAFLFSHVQANYQKILLLIFSAICLYLNFDMIYYYDGCFYGDVWDFQEYLKLLD